MIPPTPPDGPALAPLAPPAGAALPVGAVAPATEHARGHRSAAARILAVARDLVLLLPRVLQRLVSDLMTTLWHLCGLTRELVLAVLALAVALVIWMLESFGESFLLGEALQVFSPGMRASAAEINPVAALLVGWIPLLDELRASAVVTAVIAGAGIVLLAELLDGLKRWTASRTRRAAVQEALLLDPQAQESTAPAPTRRAEPGALVKLIVGAAGSASLLCFEIYLFAQAFTEHPWLGPLTAAMLLAVRVAAARLVHSVAVFALDRGRAALGHAEGAVASLLSAVPNAIDEALLRIRTLGED